MKKLSVRFDRVYCNIDGVEIIRQLNLRVFSGEVFGVLNINYLGQDKFLELLNRNSSIHYGRVYINNKLVNHYETSDNSFNSEVVIIDKDSKLIDEFSAADNFRIFSKLKSPYIVNDQKNIDAFNKYLELFNVPIDGAMIAKDLSMYEKVVIEIAREVAVGTSIFIFRDISNYIAQSDVVDFYNVLRKLQAMNKTIFYVGNHHEELFEICDRISLWEDGTIIKILNKDEFKHETMLKYSKKHSLVNTKFITDKPRVLEMEGIWYNLLRNFNLNVMTGESITILDTENIIFSSIVDIFVYNKAPLSGTIKIDGKNIDSQYNEIAYLPDYPIDNLLIPTISLEDNLFLMLKRRQPKKWFSKRFRKRQLELFKEIIEGINLDVLVQDASVKDLYTVIYYALLLYKPKVVFLSQPFASADMYLRYDLIKLINLLNENDIAVVILAVSLSDSLYVSNRIFHVYDGIVTENILGT